MLEGGFCNLPGRLFDLSGNALGCEADGHPLFTYGPKDRPLVLSHFCNAKALAL
jgi:hypothetical protein